MFENLNFTSNLKKLDEQHEEFFKGLDDLKVAIEVNDCQEKILELIDLASRYSKEHFEYEEELAEKANFPRAKDLKESHADFRATYNVIERVYSPNKEKICRVYALHILDLLYHWIESHLDYVEYDLINHISKCIEDGTLDSNIT